MYFVDGLLVHVEKMDKNQIPRGKINSHAPDLPSNGNDFCDSEKRILSKLGTLLEGKDWLFLSFESQ